MKTFVVTLLIAQLTLVVSFISNSANLINMSPAQIISQVLAGWAVSILIAVVAELAFPQKGVDR